jgi:integrase
MKKSSKPSRPSKPYRGFPLFAHANRQWAKKIRGKLHYFGLWDDPNGALQKYLDQRDDLHAGRTPRGKRDGTNVTVGELVNLFLNAKREVLESGELSSRTWDDYYRVCASVVRHFGKGRAVVDLRPEDFAGFRAALAKTKGPVALASAIIRSRVVFKWGFDSEALAHAVRFGPGFKKPSKKTMMLAKYEGGPRIFDSANLRKVINAAGCPMKAMILLGINAGLGQSDLASLPIKAIDLAGGWLTYPRPKTGVMRRCPLWPETIEALHEALQHRPTPKDEADVGLAFLTHHGAKWIREGKKAGSEAVYFNDYIGREFDKLLMRLKLKQRGGFYNLRHTFRTEAGVSKDERAIDSIMGHSRGDMGSLYTERIDDGRLQAVASVVREWLWPRAEEGDPLILKFRAG